MNKRELGYLRDIHAGLALVGLISRHGEGSLLQTAYKAYELADAMQKARLYINESYYQSEKSDEKEINVS